MVRFYQGSDMVLFSRKGCLQAIFCVLFWRARGCWPLLCLCRPFSTAIFQRCVDSKPEVWIRTQKTKQKTFVLVTLDPALDPELFIPDLPTDNPTKTITFCKCT
jgi:hypothetical protein